MMTLQGERGKGQRKPPLRRVLYCCRTPNQSLLSAVPFQPSSASPSPLNAPHPTPPPAPPTHTLAPSPPHSTTPTHPPSTTFPSALSHSICLRLQSLCNGTHLLLLRPRQLMGPRCERCQPIPMLGRKGKDACASNGLRRAWRWDRWMKRSPCRDGFVFTGP